MDNLEQVRQSLVTKMLGLTCRERGFRKSRQQVMNTVWQVVDEADAGGIEITNEGFGALVKEAWDRWREIPDRCSVEPLHQAQSGESTTATAETLEKEVNKT